MAGSMDNRIVQLQFENRQFERNIAKSKKSLEDFKKSMDFEQTSGGLEKFFKGMDALKFDTLTNNIQKLTDKFTGLGQVGEYVLSRIRAGIEGAAQSMERFVKSISTEQIGVGMDKYESLNKAVNTIIAGGKYTEDQAYNVMERAMEYTNQTSHSFQTMVGQIGALQSIGMELSEAELLLEGIGNASTKAGAGASEAASAMSLIGKVMGGSHLGLEQFNSLNQTYRVITEEWRQLAIEAGVATGDLEKKGDQIFTAKKYGKQVEVTAKTLEQTLNKKWFTSDVAKMLYGNFQFGENIDELKHPEKVADSFGKTAYLTGQRALTLKDAINAIKESVSGGWMESFRHIFGDASESAELFTNICNRVIEGIETIAELRNNILGTFGAEGRKSFWELLFGDYANDTETGLVGIMDMFDSMKNVVRQGLVDFFSIFAGATDKHMLQNDPEWLGIYIGRKLKKAVKHVQEFFQSVKNFFNEEVTVGDQTTTRLQMIQQTVQGIAGALSLAFQIGSGALAFIKQIGAQLAPSLNRIMDFFARLGQSIYATANETAQSGSILKFFGNLAESVKPITSGINAVVGALESFISKLLGIDKRGASATGFLTNLGNIILMVSNTVSKVAGPVLNFFASLIDVVSGLFQGGFSTESFRNAGKAIGNAFDAMIGAMPQKIQSVVSFVRNLVSKVKNVFKSGFSAQSFSDLKAFFKGAFSKVMGMIPEGLKAKPREILGKIKAVLSDFAGRVKNVFKSGFSAQSFADLKDFFGKAFSKVLGMIPEGLKSKPREIFEKIKSALSDMWEKVSGFFTNTFGAEKVEQLKTNLNGFVSKLSNLAPASALSGVKSGIDKIKDFFVNLWNSIKSIFDSSSDSGEGTVKFKDKIHAAIQKVISFFQSLNVDWKKLGTALLSIGAAATVAVLIYKAIKTVKTIAQGLADLGSALKDGIKLKIGDEETSDFGSKMLKLAAAVGIITYCLNYIGNMDAEKAEQGIWGLIGIMAAMGVMALVMKKAYKGVGMRDSLASVIGMIGLALAVKVMVGAILPLGDLNRDQCITILIGLAGVVAAFAILALVITKAIAKIRALPQSGSSGSGALGFGAFLAGLGVLIFSLGTLKDLDGTQLLKMGGSLVAILAIIGLFAVAMRKYGGSIAGAGFEKFAAFAVGIGILILALQTLKNLEVGQLLKMGISLAAILGLLAGFAILVGRMGGSITGMGQLAAVAGAIAILVIALLPLAFMNDGQIKQILSSLTVILTLLGGFTILVSRFGKSMKGSGMAQLIAVAGAILITVLALMPLAFMNWEQLAKMGAGLVVIMGMMIALVAVAKGKTLSTGGLVAMIAVAGAIAILVWALMPLATFDTDQIIKFCGGMIAVVGIFSLLLLAMSKMNLKSGAGAMMGLLSLAAVIGVFAISLHAIKDVPTDTIKSFATNIANLMVALAGLTLVSGVIGIKGFAALAAGIVLIGAAIALIAPILLGSIGNAMASFANDLDTVGGFMEMFSNKMGNVDEGNLDKAGRAFDKLKEIMQKVEGLSNMGIKTKAFSTAIYTLGNGIKLYAQKVAQIGDLSNNGAMKLIKDFAGCAKDMDIIAKLNLNSFIASIQGLGGAMYTYSLGAKEVTGIAMGDETNITAAVELLQRISTALAEAGGFTIPEDMPSDEQLGVFGAQLAALALSLSEFENAGRELGDGWDQSLKALEFFRDLKQKLIDMNLDKAESWAFIKELSSGSDDMVQIDEIAEFGYDIASLGEALADFQKAITYVDEQSQQMKPIDFSNGIAALNSFKELAATLPDVAGTIAKWFTHDMTMDEFGEQIAVLGIKLNDFNYQLMGGKDGEAFNKGLADEALAVVGDMVNLMQQMGAKLPKISALGGLWATITGDKKMDFKEMGGQIKSLGEGLGEFSKSLSGSWTKDNGATEALAALDSLTSIFLRLQQMETYGNAFGYADDLYNFLYGLNNNVNAVTGASYDTNAIQELAKAIGNINDAIAQLEVDKTNLDIFSQIAYGLNCLSGVNTDMNLSGLATSIGDSLITALKDYSETMQVGISTVLSTVSANLSVAEGGVNFEGVGSYIALGMAKGIRDNETAVTNAARAVAVAAYWAAMTALWARSPSRLFMQVGGYVSEGMAMGIDQKAGMVEDASTNMSQGAIDSAKNLVATMSRILAEDVNAQPTITPVLDLSQAQDELGAFGRNLSGRGYSLNTSVSAGFAGRAIRSAEYTDPNQNGNNYDGIYERMTALGEQILAMGESIKSMQVVLDSGVVAGGVSDGVDMNLGRKMFYAGRRN